MLTAVTGNLAFRIPGRAVKVGRVRMGKHCLEYALMPIIVAVLS